MFHLTIVIKNLNYDSAIEFALPLIQANPPEISGNLMVKGAVNKLINSRPSTVKGILGLIPEFIKANIIVNSVNNNHIKIENVLQNLVVKNGLSLQTANIKISRLDGTRNFNLNADFNSINYISFIKKFLPMLKLDSVQNEMNKYLNLFLPVLFNKLDDVEKIVNAIDDSEKERFIAFMVNKNSIKIIDAIYPLIGKKGLQFSIDSLSLETSK